eukprot:jgi/Hompol1/1034/HPOL_004214-RA
MHWSQRPGSFRLGIGSFIETPQGAAGNKFQLYRPAACSWPGVAWSRLESLPGSPVLASARQLRLAGEASLSFTELDRLGSAWLDSASLCLDFVGALACELPTGYMLALQVIQTMNRNGDFVKVAETNLTFPVSKLMWHPAQASAGPDLFVTSGDYLRIWELITPEDVVDCETDTGLLGGSLAQTDLRQIGCRAMLANIRKSGSVSERIVLLLLLSRFVSSAISTSACTDPVAISVSVCVVLLEFGLIASKKESCAPLTSLDWNEKDPRLCVTCSVDTTCTVWDLNTQQSKTQLIAHDKEVFDVAFSNSVDVFASVSADGSVRMFDLRALDHSTIIYETSAGISPPSGAGTHSAVAAASNPGLLRLAWNKQDSNYLATFQQESGSVLILDVRSPAVPATELHGHGASVSCIGWAPHSSEHICTAGDDAQAFVWDLSQSHRQKVITTPLLSFTAELPINNLSCGSAADTQAIADMVHYYLQLYTITEGREPPVSVAATLFQSTIYKYKDQLMAGVIVAGWDPVEGPAVYTVPLGGSLHKRPFTISGSGSAFIYGYCDANFKENMTREEAIQFVMNSVSLAMSRDGSSGGTIRLAVINEEGVERVFVPGNKLPTFWEG